MLNMGTRWSKPLIAASFVLAALTPAAAGSQASPAGSGSFEAGLQLGYLSGDFGSDVDTDIESMAARLTWKRSRGELKVTLPFLRMSSEGDVRIVGGQPVPPVSGLPVPGLPGPQASHAQGERRTVTGQGDAKARAELFVLKGTRRRPWVTLAAEVKAPTADEDKGFGTGETDLSAGFGVVQPLGRSSLLLDASFTKIGDPDDFDYEDVVGVALGVSVPVGARPGRSVYAFVENRTHPIEGLEDRRDVQLGTSIKLGAEQRVRWSAGVLYGLTDSAEDLGVSFAIGRVF